MEKSDEQVKWKSFAENAVPTPKYKPSYVPEWYFDTGTMKPSQNGGIDFAKTELEVVKTMTENLPEIIIGAIDTEKAVENLKKKAKSIMGTIPTHSKFKVGDAVVLISENDPWLKKSILKLGDTSVVTEVDKTTIKTSMSNYLWIDSNCFELAKPCCEMCDSENDVHCPLDCVKYKPTQNVMDLFDSPKVTVMPKPTLGSVFNMPKCNKCSSCSSLGHCKCCPLFGVGKKMSKTKASGPMVIPKAKSAKAQSVIDLAQSAPNPYTVIGLNELRVFPNTKEDEIKEFIQSNGGKVFARPCPLSPVHGFVDSRVITSMKQFNLLVKEIEERKEKDEILEILLMPVIKATHSAIFTPYSVTIGEGNDGATAGGNVVMINTPTNLPERFISKKILKKYTRENEVPFIELVDTKVVQVRSGASVNCSDFIPKDTKIRKIHTVTPDVDLVNWKKLVENFKEGDVIYANSITCHGAVHGVANNVPVITSRKPKVGEVLKAGDTKPASPDRIAEQLGFLLEKKIDFDYAEVLHGWKFLHLLGANMTAGREELLAYTLFYSMFGGIAACLGEYRHAHGKKLKGFGSSKGRETIFIEAFQSKRDSFDLIYKVWPYFLSPTKFPSSGFGGPNWANCAQLTIELSRLLSRFIASPSQKGLQLCVEKANDLIHAQHNGGLLFNKFGSTQQEITDIMTQTKVITRLLQLKSGKPKGKGWKLLLAHMDKPTPASVAKYQKQRDNMDSYEKEASSKTAEDSRETEESTSARKERISRTYSGTEAAT